MEQVGVKEMDDPSSLKFADREKSVALSYLVAHPFKYATFHLLSTIPFYIGSSIDTAERAVYLRGIAKDSPPPNVNITTAMAPADVNVSHLILTGHIQEGLRALTDNFPVLLERLLWFILCVASLGAVLRGIYRRVEGVSVAVLFFGVIVAFGILTGPVAYSRYRMPIDSFIFILGISGIVLLLHPLYTRARLYL